MLNSKLEKVLLLLVWYIVIIALRFICPIREEPSVLGKFIVVIFSSTIVLIIYRLYFYLTNKYILNAVNSFLKGNQPEDANIFLDKCLRKRKNNYWLIACKLYVLIMCGHIGEFERALSKCAETKKLKGIARLDFVKGLEGIIEYFRFGDCTNYCLQTQYWNKLTKILSNKNASESILLALNVYDTKFKLIKSVLAYKLYFAYLKLDDTKKAEYYYNEALIYAPSQEIACYITNAKEKF